MCFCASNRRLVRGLKFLGWNAAECDGMGNCLDVQNDGSTWLHNCSSCMQKAAGCPIDKFFDHVCYPCCHNYHNSTGPCFFQMFSMLLRSVLPCYPKISFPSRSPFSARRRWEPVVCPSSTVVRRDNTCASPPDAGALVQEATTGATLVPNGMFIGM